MKMQTIYESIIVLLVIWVGAIGYYAYRTHLELNGARSSAKYAQTQAVSYKKQWRSVSSENTQLNEELTFVANKEKTTTSALLGENSDISGENTDLEGQNLDLEQQNQDLQSQLDQ